MLTEAVQPGDVLAVATRRLEALDASEWAQGTRATPAWRESDLPLQTAEEVSSLGHLAFSLMFDDAPFVAGRFNTQGAASVQARIVLDFIYRLRANDRAADARRAWNAARQAMGALALDWSLPINGTSGTTLDGVTTTPENLGRPAIAPDSSMLLMRLSVLVQFDISFPGA